MNNESIVVITRQMERHRFCFIGDKSQDLASRAHTFRRRKDTIGSAEMPGWSRNLWSAPASTKANKGRDSC